MVSNYKCEHGRRKDRCKECGGVGVCEHNRVRIQCSLCGGTMICKHQRRKDRCKECKGSQICQHNRRKEECKDCGGKTICIHHFFIIVVNVALFIFANTTNQRGRCKECGGGQICEHYKRRDKCPDCKGREICKLIHPPYSTGCRTIGNRKLHGYCSHCFVNIFPKDPRTLTMRKKSKEPQITTHIFSKYEGFKNDKPFYIDLEGGYCT